MRVKYEVVKIKPQSRWLDVTVEVTYPGTKRWVTIKVPWRMLNEQYEDVVNAMEAEALKQMKTPSGDQWLPLEKWE